MKKELSLYLSILITLSSLTACGKASAVNDTVITTTPSETTVTTTTTAATTTPQSEITTTTTTTTMSTTTTPTTTTQTSISMAEPVSTDVQDLNSVQENSIAWLNYLTMLTQEINSSKNSKLFLEEAYSSLINNTNPENVNEITESYLASLLDTIEKYRMITVKRDRLKYIYEQNQAKAIKEAVPNPVALLSATSSLNPQKLAASIVYMAVDSYSSYSAYTNEINQEYLKSGWELDDEEAETLHESRKRAFLFMLDIVDEDNLPGYLALNENSVKRFVECKNNDNVHQQIQFLESNEDTYREFGNYWLLLAECYYNNEQYDKCLESIAHYERLDYNIFRKDYYLAKVLPLAIASASKVYVESRYISAAERYLEIIKNNTESEDWSLKFFAAEIYADLYSRTNNEKYLRAAYDIVLNNVNYLVKKQDEINKAYCSEVKEIPVTEEQSKEEKKQIKDYNKALKEKRETELPEVYEPLAINCELLASIAEKMQLTQSDKNRISGILSDAFLTQPLNELFIIDSYKNTYDAQFVRDYGSIKLILPISCLSENAQIKVTVSDNGSITVYDDWNIKEVERPNKEDYSSFKATFTSKSINDFSWSKDSSVKIEIFNGDYSKNKPTTLSFKVSNYKERFVGFDTVEFEQVN